jgi:hypothetical protein
MSRPAEMTIATKTAPLYPVSCHQYAHELPFYRRHRRMSETGTGDLGRSAPKRRLDIVEQPAGMSV